MSFLRPSPSWHLAKGTYTALRQIREGCPNVWLGRNDDRQHVILKEAPNSLLYDNEVNALDGYLRGHASFRQLVHTIPDQKIAAFEYLADNLHSVLYSRPRRRLEEEEVKRVTKVVLEGLVTMHEKNMAHTDIKPENIVVDFDQHGIFCRIRLIDLGDSVVIEPITDHPFSHPTYRAPEALFDLPWTTKVDLWSLGTLIMQGLTGGRMFSPLDMEENDECYLPMVVTLQCAYFGPFPHKYVDLSDDFTTENLDSIERLVMHKGGRRTYRNTLAANISKDAIRFLDKMMKLDPRDRPSPQELLQDQWLSGVVD